MMREKITKSLQGRILLISMIGLVACILSLYMVSSITIQSVEQHRLENSLMANMSNEMDHLEFCYFTMVRMMQQMGEDGSIGSMLEDTCIRRTISRNTSAGGSWRMRSSPSASSIIM
nr:hypothetical protein [uncultured Acetatifactor sp.]